MITTSQSQISVSSLSFRRSVSPHPSPRGYRSTPVFLLHALILASSAGTARYSCHLNLISFFARRFFPSTSVPTTVAVECIWTTCFVIFNLSRSSPFACLYGCAGLDKECDNLVLVLSLYSLGMEGDVKRTTAHMPFLLVEICCWSLTGLSKC